MVSPLRKGPSGPPAVVDTSIDPLSRALYVDPNGSDEGTRDGSIAHPFLLIQEAFDSKFVANRDFECSFLIVPCFNGEKNAGPLSIPANDGMNTFVSIVGQCGSNRSIETTSQSTGMGAIALLGAVTIDGTSQNTAVNFQNVTVEDVVTAQTSPGNNVRLSFSGCQVSAIDAANADLLLVATSAEGDVTAGSIEAYDSTSVSPPPGQTWTAGVIRLDGATNLELHMNGVTLSGSVIVLERQARATISVTVPALGAGVLGRVNVDVSGTELDGVDAGDPVLVNPTEDISPSGADGGFLASFRVSAPNTVRLSFKGSLAGGASDFTFTRL